MSIVKVQGNASGTGIFTVASPNSNTDRTLTLPDNTGTLVSTGSTAGVTQAMLASGVAGNGPSFSAYLATTGGSVSSTTFTKCLFDTEIWDTNSNFASSTFTPTVAGYYQINASYQLAAPVSGFLSIYKNGGGFKRGVWGSGLLQDMTVSGLVYCNGTTDYIDIYIYQASGSSQTPQGSSTVSWFDGVLVRSA